MIDRLVGWCLEHRIVTLGFGLVIIIAGAVAFRNLPIEAYPDIADTWVQVIVQWPGHAAEEIEQQITVPAETEFYGVPHHIHLRSTSLFGLAVMTIIFDEQTDTFTARQYVLEKLAQIQFPNGVSPVLGPMSSPVGQVYWYILEGDHSPGSLKEIQEWTVQKYLKSVPGVADVSGFGGPTKQFQVLLDPSSLTHYSLAPASVVQALAQNNQNSGGGFIYQGDQTFNVRGVGRINSTDDVANVVVSQKGGSPIRVRNLGRVEEGSKERFGKISYSEHGPGGTIIDHEDAVEGIVFSRKGEQDESVLEGLHEKVKELNAHILPAGVKIRAYLDRSELIHLTTHTVEENLFVGMLLVFAILLFFLGNLRTALIVTITVPLALLMASIFLEIRKIPANLLSLGALDFGMVVDGAIVMVENIYRYKQEARARWFASGETLEPPRETLPEMVTLIRSAAREVQKPIVYAIGIIILAYLPIFTLQRIEGRLFTPMAWTVAFALIGALIIVLTIVPVLCALLMRGELKEWHNPILEWLSREYRRTLEIALSMRNKIVWGAVISFALTLILAFGGPIGSEFLPHLDEGSIWVRGTLPPSASLALAESTVKKMRNVFMQFVDVPITVCQVGRPDDGTDATGFFNTECYVPLKPHGDWKGKFSTKEQVIEAMSKELEKIPGVSWNFSQPISDNVEEMMSGVKGSMVVKLYGDDLKILGQKAGQIKKVLGSVRGVTDLGIFEELGQPNVNLYIDREKVGRYGLNISDVQDTVETAVGGRVATQLIDGEKRFDLTVRYLPEFRSDVDRLRGLTVTTPDGYRIPLEELATIRMEEGASLIYREDGSRYIAVKFSVRGRDLAGTIDEAQAVMKKKLLLPSRYHLAWSGEFENQKRAEERLRLVVPLTIFAIFIVLYFIFRSWKWASIIMVNVAIARIGGVLALFLTGTNFSVSSGIGFLALFGVSIQTGILLISYMNQMRREGKSIREAVVEGSILRLRPILMTGLVATFGLLPAAFSHAIGSDSQRPLAIVIVGGLVADLIMGFYLLPTLYLWFAKEGDILTGE